MRTFLRNFAAAMLLAALSCVAAAQSIIVSGATGTGASTPVVLPIRGTKTYQAAGTTTAGSGSVTVQVQGTLDGTNFDSLCTFTLTLSTTTTSNSCTSDDRYAQHRVNVSAISGTGASVSVRAGGQ